MSELDKIRSAIDAAKAEVQRIKISPCPTEEARAAIDRVLCRESETWRSFEEHFAHRVAVMRSGHKLMPDFTGKELPLAAVIHFNHDAIVDSIMAQQKTKRTELNLPPAMSEQDRDVALNAAALKLYELELQEAAILESLPDLPRSNANTFAMLGLPAETAGRAGVFATIGD